MSLHKWPYEVFTMSELLKVILQNYEAYIRHKRYIAASMIYMYIALIVTVFVLTATAIIVNFSLKGLMAGIVIALAIIGGLALSLYLTFHIWYVMVDYYMAIFKMSRRPMKNYMVFPLWGVAFTIAYTIPLMIPTPPEYFSIAWLLGVGLGNLFMGIYFKDFVSIGAGVVCCILFMGITVLPKDIQTLMAMLCMLYAYTGAGIAYLVLGKRELKKLMRGS